MKRLYWFLHQSVALSLSALTGVNPLAFPACFPRRTLGRMTMESTCAVLGNLLIRFLVRWHCSLIYLHCTACFDLLASLACSIALICSLAFWLTSKLMRKRFSSWYDCINLICVNLIFANLIWMRQFAQYCLLCSRAPLRSFALLLFHSLLNLWKKRFSL